MGDFKYKNKRRLEVSRRDAMGFGRRGAYFFLWTNDTIHMSPPRIARIPRRKKCQNVPNENFVGPGIGLCGPWLSFELMFSNGT